MNLRQFYFLFGLILLSPGVAAAQECRCCKKRDEGQALYNTRKYEEAIKKWETAQQLSDAAEKCPNLATLIGKARQRIKERTQSQRPASAPAEKNNPNVASFLVKVQGGSFLMGDVLNSGSKREYPVHNVTVGNFYISKYEVSFDEFDAFCTATGRKKPFDNGEPRGKIPVTNVDWYDAIEYCNWLSVQHGLKPVYAIGKNSVDGNNHSSEDYKKWSIQPSWNANGYRLPTEAEWEYAARAVRATSGKVKGGGKVRFANGRDILDPSEANYNGSPDLVIPYSKAGQESHHPVPVDALVANPLGLKNMSGNVAEWCWDWAGDNYEGVPKDGKGLPSGKDRILRGGGFLNGPTTCRSSFRSFLYATYFANDIGFRVARGF